MLFLLFQLGQDRYALDVADVAEVLPMVRVKQSPRAPDCVAGLFDYRGTPVPLIDLSQLALNRPARQGLSTRIIVVHYAGGQGRKRWLGLIAEKATDTLRREAGDFADPGLAHPHAPYLGPVTSDARGLVQWIRVDALLPPAVRELLFNEPEPDHARP